MDEKRPNDLWNLSNIDDAELNTVRWYVMRDLKRPNSRIRAYNELSDKGIEVFTPMITRLDKRGLRPQRVTVPFMPDLLFVHSSKAILDHIVARTPTLQYRFVKGGEYKHGMTVDDASMARFIKAVSNSNKFQILAPSEVDVAAVGSKIRIVGGALDGIEGRVLKVRGARRRRLIVEIPALLSVVVEVDKQFIQLVD